MVPPCGQQNTLQNNSAVTDNENCNTFTAYVRGIVEGSDMHIMLDTGSSISFISENIRMSLPSLNRRPLKKDFVLSKSVTGQHLDTLGTVNIALRLGSLNLQHEVQVIRNVSQTIILGWDFLQQHFAVLDLGRGLCHLHNQDLPLLSTTEMTPDSCSAHVTECTTIPPHCEMHCAVKLMPVAAHLCTPTGYNGLLEPYHTDLDGVAVARTLARADNGFTVVRVMNPTNTPIVLQPGMQLGQFTPVTDNEISTAAPTVCQVSAPPPTSPQSLT